MPYTKPVVTIDLEEYQALKKELDKTEKERVGELIVKIKRLKDKFYECIYDSGIVGNKNDRVTDFISFLEISHKKITD